MSEKLIDLKNNKMVVTFDKHTGTIWSIKEQNGKYDTNFVANAENIREEVAISHWTGDLVTTVWELPEKEQDTTNLEDCAAFQSKGKWKRELTGASGDIRKVKFDNEKICVSYLGHSKHELGIKSFDLKMTFAFDGDNALVWDIEITNKLAHVLEVGELGIILAANDDYQGVYEGKSPLELTKSGKYGNAQKHIHERKVFAHHFAGGHSSYAVVQRPLGDPPFLLMHTGNDTAIECFYPAEGQFPWPGVTVMAMHSWATKQRRRWRDHWINRNTSLVLKPGEKRSYQLRYSFVNGYKEIREKLFDVGNLGIRCLPSMVVSEDLPVHVEVQSKYPLDKIDILSDNVRIHKKKRIRNKTLLTLSFKYRGQKSLKLHYNKNRWTTLHFYCVENLEQLIKARGKFIINRQFYKNPDDPFNRHHMFVPFDYRNRTIMLDSDEAWEVGGSDEFGFSEPLYLAEKNVYYPSKEEIETLETYVDDCLFKHIQNPETYLVRASLFWKDRYPSSPWGHWPKERGEQLWRTYNYPHPANIYHALYKIGKLYGLLNKRQPMEYLQMAYETCLRWFTTGHWPHIGLMCGTNALNILEDLKKEGRDDEYRRLREEMQKCSAVFSDDPYPYGSELFIDQTAHEQVFFFTRYFGDFTKSMKTLQVIKAMRGGDQPTWFNYGQDKRGTMSCWYSETLNGWALLQGFEDTGDMDMFIKGFAGVMSITANLLPDGMGFGWFEWGPDHFAHEPARTLDNGIATYGFFKSIKSYVMSVEPFGLVGCGCKVRKSKGMIIVQPADGLKKRLRFVDDNIEIMVSKGEIRRAVLNSSEKKLALDIRDSTKVIDHAEFIIHGLKAESCKISMGSRRETIDIKDKLIIQATISDAKKIQIQW